MAVSGNSGWAFFGGETSRSNDGLLGSGDYCRLCRGKLGRPKMPLRGWWLMVDWMRLRGR
jgi:hypothetical protein